MISRAATIDALSPEPLAGGQSPDGQATARGGLKFQYASGSRPLDGYTIKRGIGRGGFGEVYFAASDAGKEVALKHVERNLEVELRGVSQCLNLKHVNLIDLYDVRYDEQGLVSRLAAYWALTEKFVQHSYADGQSRIVFVSYEELCRRRGEVVSEMLQKLGLAPVAGHDSQVLDTDSSTTSDQRRGASVAERLGGWKQTLSTAEIASIESIAEHFGFEDRLTS